MAKELAKAETQVWTPQGIGRWPRIGQQIVIQGYHPHSGEVARVVAFARPDYGHSDCPIVQTAVGTQFFITAYNEWKAI